MNLRFDGFYFIIRLAKPSQVSFGKNPEHKRTINSAEDIGAPVQYEFRVSDAFLYFLFKSYNIS